MQISNMHLEDKLICSALPSVEMADVEQHSGAYLLT